MYRDDVCAVCEESLPPDHFYCREHAAIVDDLLHELGERVPRLVEDLAAIAGLMDKIAGETWDYLAEQQADDPDWPPALDTIVHADGGDVDVDVDADPGMVTVRVTQTFAASARALHDAMRRAGIDAMAEAALAAEDVGATH